MEMEFEEDPNDYARTVQYQNEGLTPENLQDSSIDGESRDQRQIGNFMQEDENPEDDIHSYIPSVQNTPQPTRHIQNLTTQQKQALLEQKRRRMVNQKQAGAQKAAGLTLDLDKLNHRYSTISGDDH